MNRFTNTVVRKRMSVTAFVAAACLLLSSPLLVVAGDHGKSKSEEKQTKNIVDTAAGNEKFTILVSAIQAAGLDKVLSSAKDGPFTVFAPTNEAFEKLPEGTLDKLLNEEGMVTLKAILTHHVVKGNYPAARVVKSETLKSMQGGKLTVEAGEEAVTINNAKVVATDIHCTNGVIHVIDTVLMP